VDGIFKVMRKTFEGPHGYYQTQIRDLKQANTTLRHQRDDVIKQRYCMSHELSEVVANMEALTAKFRRGP